MKRKKNSYLIKLLYTILLLFLLFNIFSFSLLPLLTKNYIKKQLSIYLHRDVFIEEFKINPYKLSFQIKNLSVSEKENNDTFFSSSIINCRISFFSLIKAKPQISNLHVKNPFLKIIRYERNMYNFSDLLKKQIEKKSSYFTLYDFKIENGTIIFNDLPEKKIHLIKKINFILPSLSNSISSQNTKSFFSAVINKTPIEIEGEIKTFTDYKEIDFNVNINNVYLPKYSNYAPVSSEFNIRSGDLTGNFEISIIQPIRSKMFLKIKGKSELKNFEMVDKLNNSFLKITKIQIINSFDLLNKTIEITELSLISPEIQIFKDKNNNLNIFKLFSVKETPKKEKKNISENFFTFELKNLKIDDGKIFFSDMSLKNTFNTTLKNIIIKGNQISNKKNKIGQFYFSGETKDKEFINISGIVGLNPIFSEGIFNIENFSFYKFLPYFKNNIMLNIESGNFASKGKYVLNLKNKNIKFLNTDLKLEKLFLTNERNVFKIPSIIIKNVNWDIKNKQINVDILKSENGFFTAIFKDNKLPFFSGISRKEGLNFENINQWQISLNQINIDNYKMELKGFFTENPISIEQFKFNLYDIYTYKSEKTPFNFFFKLNKKDVFGEGLFIPKPIKIHLKTNISEIAIPDFQNLLRKTFNLKVKDGIFSAQGNLTYEKNEDLSSLNYTGTALVKKLKIVDELYNEDLCKADIISLKNLNFNSKNFFEINEIFVDAFYGNIILHPDGEINIMNIFKINRENFSKENLNICINIIDFKNGQLNLIDKSTKTKDEFETFNFNGSITNFSIFPLKEKEQKNIEFQAQIEGINLSRIIEKVKFLTQKTF